MCARARAPPVCACVSFLLRARPGAVAKRKNNHAGDEQQRQQIEHGLVRQDPADELGLVPEEDQPAAAASGRASRHRGDPPADPRADAVRHGAVSRPK